MKTRKFFICIILIALLIPCVSFAVSAEDMGLPEPPKLEGIGAYYFYNITTDKLISEENSTEQLRTSTSAKVMSGLLICEALRPRLNDNIQVTEDMIKDAEGVKYGYVVGETVLVKDLLYSAICGSYNDAMHIAAYVVGGDIPSFVNMMNKKASELGAFNTHYENPLGYPEHSDMLTTASDVFKIALEAQKNELYMEISSAQKYTTSQGDEFHNRNYLISSYHNITPYRYFDKCFSGMNAGTSTSSGNWSIVTVAEHKTQKYLCVILGGTESSEGEIYAYSAANKLADWAFASYKSITLFKQGYEVGLIEIGLTGIAGSNAPYVTETDLNIYIPSDVSYNRELLTTKVEFDSDKIDAPANKGDKVGVLKVYYQDECVGKCNLVLDESYDQNVILAGIDKISDYVKSRAFFITVVTFVVLLPIVIIYIRSKSRRSHRKTYMK